jgi:hypothetical protein
MTFETVMVRKGQNLHLYTVLGTKEYKIGPTKEGMFGVMARWGKEISGRILTHH